MDLSKPARTYNFENETFTPGQIAQIAAQKGLVGLAFAHCNITDRDVEQFAGLTKLVNVLLEYCDITDKALEHLAQLPKLNYLFITGAAITGEGLAHFKGNRKLEALWLVETQFCDEHIHNLLHFERLNTVRIHNTAITAEGIMSVAGNPSLDFVPNETLSLEVIHQFQAEQRRLQKKKEEYSQEDFEAAKERLLAFFEAMNRWEALAEQQGFTPTVERECRAIFSEHCVEKERKYARPECMHHAGGPNYTYTHQSVIDCEQLTRNRIALFTRDSYLNNQHKYVVVRKEGIWRIDEGYIHRGRWSKTGL